MTFTDRASSPVSRYGLSIIPLDPRSKAPFGSAQGRPRWGINSKTNTLEGVRAFAAQVPADANYGICSDDDHSILETDDLMRLLGSLSRPIPDTLTVSARKNRGYFVFKQTAKTRAVRGIPEVAGLFEWRNRGYCVGYGSIHPGTQKEYRLVRDVEPVEMPDWLVDELLALQKNAPPSVRDSETGEVDEDALDVLLEALHKRGEPQDMLDADCPIITSLHPTLKPLIAHLYQGPETSDDVAALVRAVGSKFGHREPEEKDVEDVLEWMNREKCKPCFCQQCQDAVDFNLPESFVWSSRINIPPREHWYSDKPEWQQEGPLWLFGSEEEFALFKYRVEKTPAWAYEYDPTKNADYGAWKAKRKSAGVSDEDWRLVSYSEIRAVKVDWLWKGFLAIGKLTMVNGEPGGGKSLITVDTAARVTCGRDWADSSENPYPPSAVLLLTEEEDAADTIKPRFLAAGGDTDNLITLNVGKGGLFQIEKDTAKLKRIIESTKLPIRLVILDPVADYTSVDAYKDAEVRPMLNKLREFGAEIGAAVVGVNHLNKKTDLGAIHRVAGARGWVSFARLNFLVGLKDNLRHLVPLKTNIAKDGGSLTFIIGSESVTDGDTTIEEVPKVLWQGKGTLTASDLTASDKTKDSEDDQLAACLRKLLAGGKWCSAAWVIQEADARGWPKRTVQRVADKIGVEGGWTHDVPPKREWRLPPPQEVKKQKGDE
jgi:putative DNA primase/helicase